MNKYIKALLTLFLLVVVSRQAFAQEVFHLWESGISENVEFKEYDGMGLVYIDDKLIFDGINGQKIDGIVTKKIGEYNYIDICGDVCFTYILDKEYNLYDINLGFKTFPSFVKEFGKYIIFASTFLESDEWAIAMYDKTKNSYVGTRYLNNLDIDGVEIENTSFVLKKGNERVKTIKLDSFNEKSFSDDNKIARKKQKL